MEIVEKVKEFIQRRTIESQRRSRAERIEYYYNHVDGCDVCKDFRQQECKKGRKLMLKCITDGRCD